MKTTALEAPNRALIERASLPGLFEALVNRGYLIIAPTVRDGAIVYDEIKTDTDLPIGWTDEQAAGNYRLKRRDDEAVFGYTVGPYSWKRFLHSPAIRLWQGARNDGRFQIIEEPLTAPKYALVGVRSCELSAIAIQDKVFIGGQFKDNCYAERRNNCLIIAINCGQAELR